MHVHMGGAARCVECLSGLSAKHVTPRSEPALLHARMHVPKCAATQGPDGDSETGLSLDNGGDALDTAEKGQAAQQPKSAHGARRPTWRVAITTGAGRVGTRARKAWVAARPLPAEEHDGQPGHASSDPPDVPRRPVDQAEWVRH